MTTVTLNHRGHSLTRIYPDHDRDGAAYAILRYALDEGIAEGIAGDMPIIVHHEEPTQP